MTLAAKIWTPPPKLTISEWADQHRMLSAEASAEPGKWRTSRAEYQRGIMDALSDPDVERVVCMKSAQVGWTEILNNVAGFFISQDASPILMVHPTVDMGRAWSTDRFAPMIRDSAVFSGLISDPRSRDGDNTVLRKAFPGGHLTVAGANSPAGLASRPIRVLLCDEVDRYPPSAGTEGDPITLGEKRTTTYWNRKILIGSTPTIRGSSRIEKAFEDSDQRYFFVPCPHCAEMQRMRWPNVRWTGGDSDTAAYHCAHCGAAWSDAQRWAAIRRGEWRATKPFTGAAGFHLNELYSPWRKVSQIVKAFLESKDTPELLKAWVNTALGETWQERGDAPDWQRLWERREPLKRGAVPRAALAITGALDVQHDYMEFALWAWSHKFRSWLVDTVRIEGRADTEAPWQEFRALVERAWPVEGGGEMRMLRVGVDTGGSHTAAVYAALRAMRHVRGIIAMKGTDTAGKVALVSGPTPVDVMESGRKIRRGLRLWTVASGHYKSDLYGRLWLKPGEDGALPPAWVSLPDWMDAEHVKQLVGEQLVSVTHPKTKITRREWRKLRERNEQLDLAVYARAALTVAGADKLGDSFFVNLGYSRGEPIATSPEAPRTPASGPFPHVDTDSEESAAQLAGDESDDIEGEAEPDPTAVTAVALDAALSRLAAPPPAPSPRPGVATVIQRGQAGGARIARMLA